MVNFCQAIIYMNFINKIKIITQILKLMKSFDSFTELDNKRVFEKNYYLIFDLAILNIECFYIIKIIIL